MKQIKTVVAAMLVVTLFSCNSQSTTKKELKTEIDSVSYALGLNMGNQMRVNFEEMDKSLYMQGFSNGLDSTNIMLKDDEIRKVLNTFFAKKQQQKQEEMRKAAIKKAEEEFGEVKKAGEDFLAANKTKEGVKTTDSGLQYIVLKEGTGVKPAPTDRVKVHYHGTLIDGTVFDSSVEKGKPFETFANRGVIKGWLEAFKLMKVGSKLKIFVPQELAYGAFPHRGGKVRPFDTLIFEMEILDIVK